MNLFDSYQRLPPDDRIKTQVALKELVTSGFLSQVEEDIDSYLCRVLHGGVRTMTPQQVYEIVLESSIRRNQIQILRSIAENEGD